MALYEQSDFFKGLERGWAEGSLISLSSATIALEAAVRGVERGEGFNVLTNADRNRELVWAVSIIELSLAALKKSLPQAKLEDAA